MTSLTNKFFLSRREPFGNITTQTKAINHHAAAYKIVKFEIEKETKNSIRYKEVPEEGQAPIVGTLYLQKWFAGNSKNIQLTIEKQD